MTFIRLRQPNFGANQELVCLKCGTASDHSQQVFIDVCVEVKEETAELLFVYSHDNVVALDNNNTYFCT